MENATTVELAGPRFPVRWTPKRGLRQVDFVRLPLFMRDSEDLVAIPGISARHPSLSAEISWKTAKMLSFWAILSVFRLPQELSESLTNQPKRQHKDNSRRTLWSRYSLAGHCLPPRRKRDSRDKDCQRPSPSAPIPHSSWLTSALYRDAPSGRIER